MSPNGDDPRTVTATADSFNEAVGTDRILALPEGVHILSTSVVVHALVSHVDGRASTVQLATVAARNQLPMHVELVERSVEVRQSPARSAVTVEAFDERAAIALVARQAPPGHLVENAATLLSPGGRRLGIGKPRPNQYEVGVLRRGRDQNHLLPTGGGVGGHRDLFRAYSAGDGGSIRPACDFFARV